MKTRCKAGDVARFVINGENLGKIVVVTGGFYDWKASTFWWTHTGHLQFCDGQRATHVADHALRPLGNPGDDEVDEFVCTHRIPDLVREAINQAETNETFNHQHQAMADSRQHRDAA